MFDDAKRFAGERLKEFYDFARDNVAVPVLDSAMEAGVVPATQGMVVRWASGTETPLTKTPKDLRQAIPSAIEKARARGTRQVEGFQQIQSDVDGQYKGPLHNSLGAFWANPETGEVEDAYDFAYYDPRSEYLQKYTGGFKSGIDMLKSGEERGIIPIAHSLGLTKPGQSYPVRFNFKK